VSKDKKIVWLTGLTLLALAMGPAGLAVGAQSPDDGHAPEATGAVRSDLATGLVALAAALAGEWIDVLVTDVNTANALLASASAPDAQMKGKT